MDAIPFAKARKAILAKLNSAVAVFGFAQYRDTNYFFRDRGTVRDVFFISKTRGPAINVIYGCCLVPDSIAEWQNPGVRVYRYLQDQKLYWCKYSDHIDRIIPEIFQALEAEALPWFESIQAQNIPSGPAVQAGHT